MVKKMDRWEFWDEHFKDYYKEGPRVEPSDDFLDDVRRIRNYLLFLVNWNLEIVDDAHNIRFLRYNPDIKTIDDLKEIIDIAFDRIDNLMEKIEGNLDNCAKKCLKIIFDAMNIKYETVTI